MRHPRTSHEHFCFETPEEAAAEDELRARRLFRRLPSVEAGLLSNAGLEREDRDDMQTLAEVLKHNAGNQRVIATAASAVAMRRVRRRFTRALLDFAGESELEVWVATIVPPRWSFSGTELRNVTARSLRARFRTELRRAAGPLEEGGILVGALHGEFDPRTGRFQLHVHAACFGASRRWVEALRARPMFRSTAEVARPIFVQPVRAPQAQFSYLLKTLWAAKPTVQRRDVFRRIGRSRRIPEPYHSVVLLWLHRERPSDLLVIMGARLKGSRITPL